MEDKRTELLRSMGYSDKAINMVMNKVNLGEMENPTVTSREQGTCGDVMFLYLRMEDDTIRDASYEFVGCAGLQSAGAGITEMVKGMSGEGAEKITSQDLIRYLESLPKAKYECAEIACGSLRKALGNLKKARQQV